MASGPTARSPIARSSAASTRAGDSGWLCATPRSTLRTWAMAAAACRSCPVTSPMTSIVLPSPTRKASYQSPPTWARSAAGR